MYEKISDTIRKAANQIDPGLEVTPELPFPE